MKRITVGFLVIFILALAFLVVPLAAYAQHPEQIRRVGVLYPSPENTSEAMVRAVAQALGRLGWSEGKNIRIDWRFVPGDPALLETYAAELVGLAPDAILVWSAAAVAALRRQTRTTPIVFVTVPDPVALGFVQSLARPGGNITGFVMFDAPIMGKWLELLKEVAPGVTRVTVIFNPDIAPSAPLFTRAIEAAALSLGMTVTLAPVHDDAGIEQAIAVLARAPGGGLICLLDSFTFTHRDVIIAAAAGHGVPLIGGNRTFPRAGGLMTYWPDQADELARAASYIDRILKGASPADLPVQQPMKYSLIINLKTAKALGLTIPPTLLFQADELIQ
jgi:putative ABC transport system substrate-binding protein